MRLKLTMYSSKVVWAQANLEEKEVELFHQDSLEPALISPVDVTVCSLPVGYYPNDERRDRL
ncbi:hypothetical protein ACEQPO_21880 [Bacillus sp. SL00103]